MRNEGMAVRVAVVGLMVGLAVVPELSLAAQPEPDAGAAAKGQITYVRYCVSCHGQGAKGDGPLASDLRVTVPDLTTLAARNAGKYPYERVGRIIESGEPVRGHGTADMPAWGDVFKKTKGTDEATVDAAVRNLNHYIWSVQPPPAPLPRARSSDFDGARVQSAPSSGSALEDQQVPRALRPGVVVEGEEAPDVREAVLLVPLRESAPLRRRSRRCPSPSGGR